MTDSGRQEHESGREGVRSSEGMLLVALSCGRLPGALEIAARHALVAFGVMGERVFCGFRRVRDASQHGTPVYFYETG